MDSHNLLLVGVSAAAFYLGYKAHQSYSLSHKWRLRAQAQRAKKAAYSPKLDEVSREMTGHILSLGAYKLTAAIKAGEFSCRQVVSVYIARAFDIGRRLNLSAEENFSVALETADRLDRKLADTPEKCGRLFGVPISIKDQIDQAGNSSSCGLACLLDRISDKDAVIVRLLLAEDAIPIVRGNVCQCLMWIESENNIYGRSMNPWDLARGVGGSSGGDAGLVASHCALLAIGTDIGGSVRYPAAFCGVSALKPTPDRISNLGVSEPGEADFMLIKATSGPIAKRVSDLKAVMECWLVPEMWQQDIFVSPLPFNHALYNSTYASPKLRIAYITDNGLLTPSVSVIRAVNETAEILRRLGHELVEIKLPDLTRTINLYGDLVYSTGAAYFDVLQGEDKVWFNQLFAFAADKPNLSCFLLRLLGMRTEADLATIKIHTNIKELTDMWREAARYKTDLIELWERHRLDFLIGPVYAFPAPLHKGTQAFLSPLTYSMIWNFVEFPSGVLPVTNVRDSETHYESDSSWLIASHFDHQMKDAAGMPVAVQVTALPNQEERLLAVMQLIEDHTGFTCL
jgi:Asp-tRNA(Asn)/Glu-tRNA(Gln) amidotransferase A subunit family amidase